MTSTTHDHADAHGAEAHAHDFDAEPARELSAGEPRTPGWVPALGAALFLIAGVAWMATGDADGADSAAASKPPVVTQAQAPAEPRPTTPAAPTVAPPGLRDLSADQRAQIQKQLELARPTAKPNPHP
jgi:hypothetical protein